MISKKVFILNSIQDALHYIKDNASERSNKLFCTHSSVKEFLSAKSIECIELSDLFSYEEISLLKKHCAMDTIGLLQKMDTKYEKEIFEFFGIENLKIFYTIFSYLGIHHALGYMFFVKAIDKIFVNYGPDKIFIYDRRFDTLLETNTDMALLCNIALADKPIEIIKHNSIFGHQYKILNVGVVDFFIKSIFVLRKAFLKTKKLFKLISKKNNKKDKKTIFVYSELYDLDFLRDSKFDVLDERQLSDRQHDGIGGALRLPLLNSPASIDELLEKEYVELLCRNSKMLLDIANKTLAISSKIDLAVWGNPPIHAQKAICFGVLKSCGIPIVGAQHGSCYIDQYLPEHFQSDFERCDYYFTYGFDVFDVERVYGCRSDIPKYLNYGSTKKTVSCKIKQIDILFPITNSISVFDGGISRHPFGALCTAQNKILDWLEERGLDNDIYVKPMPHANTNNCCVLDSLSALKNIKILDYMGLTDFLTFYKTRIVIIEYPSTPLYDVIGLDTEIFLLLDPIAPYEAVALEELEKRAHCYNDVDTLLIGVDRYLAGNLASKRDDTFLNHYVYKVNARENILKAIENIIEREI